jgi:SEC-C motif-containing protein
MSCYCGLEADFSQCCEPFISGKSLPPTAERLMRSRYSAFVVKDIDYLESTLLPKNREDFDRGASEKWANSADWLGLEIVETEKGGEDDAKGTVEFIANFMLNGKRQAHREFSEFQKVDGRWFFVDGKNPEIQTFVKTEPTIGRNDPCTCGSGKKYKKCCGNN